MIDSWKFEQSTYKIMILLLQILLILFHELKILLILLNIVSFKLFPSTSLWICRDNKRRKSNNVNLDILFKYYQYDCTIIPRVFISYNKIRWRSVQSNLSKRQPFIREHLSRRPLLKFSYCCFLIEIKLYKKTTCREDHFCLSSSVVSV